MARVSLIWRPLDLIYFCFFLMHLPATLLMDLQPLYPIRFVPNILRMLPVFYYAISKDHLIGAAMGLTGTPTAGYDHYVWFKTFIKLEAFFQVPVFLLGIRGLWRNSKSIYVLLLVYAASTATTTLPCLMAVWNTPFSSSETRAAKVPSVTPAQRRMLLAAYLPFFLIPLLMTVDMSFRVLKLVRAGTRAQLEAKTK